MNLYTILESAGIAPLRETQREIYARCPMHVARTGHEDHNPSWSINQNTYRHHCFSCGYGGTTLQQLLVDVTGSAPDDLDKELAKQSFLRRMSEVGEQPEETLEPIIPILTEWSLHHAMFDVPERLVAFRHLQRVAIDAYEVRWTGKTRQWVLPLRSPEGLLLGAQYRQKGNVVTLPDGVSKSTTLFGFLQCCEGSHCTLVESPLDAVRLFGLGIPALSSLGAWVAPEQIKLLARTFTRVFVALDNDTTGNKSAEIVAPLLRKAGTTPIRWNYDGLVDDEGDPAKDVGEVESDEALLASWGRTTRMGL